MMKCLLVVLCVLMLSGGIVATTVQQLTEDMVAAMTRHDMNAMERMLDANVMIDYPTELPTGGLYKGIKGFRALGESVHAMLEDKSECKPRILFVDESGGYAHVDATCSGVFRRNGHAVTAEKCFFMRWELGKLTLLAISDKNYAEIVDAYRTNAEKTWYTMMEKTALLGSDGALDMVADDANFEMHLYPQSLVQSLGLQNLRGKNGFSELNKKLSKLMRNPMKIEVVHANDTHVTVATLLGNPRLKYMTKWFAPTGRISRDSQITVLVSQCEFRDGLLASAKMCVNRPMLPKQLFNVQRLLAGEHNLAHSGSGCGECGIEMPAETFASELWE